MYSSFSISRSAAYSENFEALEESKVKPWEILLMMFLLLISGNPFIGGHYDAMVALSVVIPLYYILTNSYRKINFKTVFIFAFLLGYEVMHAVVYSLDYSLTIFKLFLVLLLGFSVVQLLGNRFVRVLTDTMCIFGLISLVFTAACYVPGLKWDLWNLGAKLFPYKHDEFKDFAPTLLVYTFHPQYFQGEFSYCRNAGPFWESGAFAVYLNLTLYLRYLSKPIKVVKDLFDKKSLFLIFVVLSTTSTMGFLSLMLILTFFTMQLKTPLKFVFLLLVAVMGYLSFVSVEFLGSKIATQLEESDERNNRFGAALMDMKDIQKRPFIGSSRRITVVFNTQTRSQSTRRPNGLTNFIRDYGLVYFTVYFSFLFLSFSRIFNYHHNYFKPAYAFFGCVLLWLLSFSELIFDLAFFKGIIFLAAVYVPQNRHEEEEGFYREPEMEAANS